MPIGKAVDSFSKCKITVYRLLNIRLYSQKEIEDKLKVKKFSSEDIVKTIKYFNDLDLINDVQFAQAWIRSRLLRPYGIHRIRQELRRKGVDKEIIEKKLEELNCSSETNSKIQAIVSRQLVKHKGIEKQKVKQRIYQYLNRRGFDQEIILDAIKRI